jgi:S1-C subfamily serine protease
MAKQNHHPAGRPPAASVDRKAIAKAKTWTVLISNEGFEQKSRGTGMLIDSTHVLTANHMIPDNGNEMWVYIAPGRRIVHAKPVSQDKKNDLAILEIDEKVELPAYATFQAEHYDGEPIIIIGNILGCMQWYVSYGIISGDDGVYLLMDGTMTHGDSGGPWINSKGEVVGLSDWQMGDEEPDSLIKGGVSAETILAFLKSRDRAEAPVVSDEATVNQEIPAKRQLL